MARPSRGDSPEPSSVSTTANFLSVQDLSTALGVPCTREVSKVHLLYEPGKKVPVQVHMDAESIVEIEPSEFLMMT
jgi:hypothetical protein